MNNETKEAFNSVATATTYNTKDGTYVIKENGWSSRIKKHGHDVVNIDIFDRVIFVKMDREEFRASELFRQIRQVAGYMVWSGNVDVRDGKFVTTDDAGNVLWTYPGEIRTQPEIGWMPIEFTNSEDKMKCLHFGSAITELH